MSPSIFSTRPSTGHWLRLVRLPSPLVSSPSWARIADLTEFLPLESMLAFELRLWPGRGSLFPGAVDLSCRLLPSRLPDFNPPTIDLPPTLAEPPPVKVRELWLAFDSPTSPSYRPSVYARLSKKFPFREQLPKLLQLLGAGPSLASEGLIGVLDQIANAGGHVAFLGSMHARPANPLRLEIFGIRGSDLQELLRQLETPGGAQLVEAEEELLDGIEKTHLAIDWTPEGVGERIGVELSYEHIPGREPGWERLFDRLEARGLCTAEQREVALGWTGSERLEGYEPFTHLARAVSHVKLVLDPRRPAAAKLYLLVTPWPEGAGLAASSR
ncbi:MAG: hypothetical protein SX243_17635 [Acidobacteriota bacterium]|nr:hypothetical protein [Acidobacteriota bacterium]